jgi:hypothetical protein
VVEALRVGVSTEVDAMSGASRLKGKNMQTQRALLGGVYWVFICAFGFPACAEKTCHVGGADGAAGSTCVSQREGIVAWWPGEGNASDISGGAPAALQGNATFANGRVGQAFSFAGGADAVNAGNASKLRLSGGDFSVEAWVFFDSHQGDMSIVDKMAASSVNLDGWRLIKQADDRFWFCFGGGSRNRCTPSDRDFTVYSTTSVVSGQWFHIAAVKDSDGFSLYVNGKCEDSRAPLPTFVDTHSTDLMFGSNVAEPAHLDGLIDEVKLFDRALTAAEIQRMYAAGSVAECRGGFGAEGSTGAGGANEGYGGRGGGACDTGRPLGGTGDGGH